MTTPRAHAAARFSSTVSATARGMSREHTGTGFPGDFYINYHLYRHVFPTLALAGGESPDTGQRVTERELVAHR